uniref:Uncharacterized protein n=1 Tax=Brassica oleracea var. oleracea TaxID=109376 RepID=A0A0D3D3D9_BRAOL
MTYPFLERIGQPAVDLANDREESVPFNVLAATFILEFSSSQMFLMLFRDSLGSTETERNALMLEDFSRSFVTSAQLLTIHISPSSTISPRKLTQEEFQEEIRNTLETFTTGLHETLLNVIETALTTVMQRQQQPQVNPLILVQRKTVTITTWLKTFFPTITIRYAVTKLVSPLQLIINTIDEKLTLKKNDGSLGFG